MNSSYTIPMTHPKFGIHWQNWTTRIQECIYYSKHDFDYLQTFDCFAFNTPIDPDPHKFIKTKINRSVEMMETSLLCTQYLCFDSATFPYVLVQEIVREILSNRRKTNYELSVTTAFQLSNALQTNEIYLLDFPIPALTLIAVNYTGTKKVFLT